VLDHRRFLHINDLFTYVGDIITDPFQALGDEQEARGLARHAWVAAGVFGVVTEK
jgi:hypothetical protein